MWTRRPRLLPRSRPPALPEPLREQVVRLHRLRLPSRNPPRSSHTNHRGNQVPVLPAASGGLALPPSLACSGSSGSPTRTHPPRLPPTRHRRRPRRPAIRPLPRSRKCPLVLLSPSHRWGKTSCSQASRSHTASPRTSAWMARSLQSTTTATQTWIGSTRWWLNTTAAAPVSGTGLVLWKACARASNPIGASCIRKARIVSSVTAQRKVNPLRLPTMRTKQGHRRHHERILRRKRPVRTPRPITHHRLQLKGTHIRSRPRRVKVP